MPARQGAATANLAGILVYLYGEDRAGFIDVLVMFPLLLLMGEVTPKTIAVSNPVKISAGLVAGPLSVWTRLITPLRRVVRLAAGRITSWIVGKERAKENILQVDEFRTLLADIEEEGVLDATERVLIDNLLDACETEIVEIMTPRTRIKFLKDDMSVPEVVERFRQIQHPRVPVCHEHHNARAAAVLNEFGGVEGLITMRDIVKFIFGEISEGVSGQELYQERD